MRDIERRSRGSKPRRNGSFHLHIRDSVVTVATRYGPAGPGIESRWWRDFPRPSRPALGPTQIPVQGVPGLFPGGKAAGVCR